MVVKFFARYLVKPIYVFGGFGILALAASFLSAGYMLYLKFVHDVAMVTTLLPILVAMFFIVGVMTILMGILRRYSCARTLNRAGKRHTLFCAPQIWTRRPSPIIALP